MIPPALLFGASLVAVFFTACETIDPGPNFVIPNETFDADFFFCHVEPEFLFAKKCGPGDPAAGDAANGCHFNSAAVSGMPLVNHAVIDCGGGDKPLSRAQLAPGGPAQGNLQAASLEMSRDALTAPIVVRPSGAKHPRVVLAPGDPSLDVLKRWANR